MVYQFIGAFPISIAATPVTYDSSDVLQCTVSFSYMRYIRRRSGTQIDRKGFIYQYLRGERSWQYIAPRSFSWIGGAPLTWDDIWGGDTSGDYMTEAWEQPTAAGSVAATQFLLNQGMDPRILEGINDIEAGRNRN
jgi:hypothetical protein